MSEAQDAPAASPEMKTINVATAFTVIMNGAPFKVAAGVQKVPAEVADHWYTQKHLVKGGFGTPEYAKACRMAADAAFIVADEAVQKYEGLEDAAKGAELAAGLEISVPAAVRLRRKEPAQGDGASDVGDGAEASGHGAGVDIGVTADDFCADSISGADTIVGDSQPETAGGDSISGEAGADSISGSEAPGAVTEGAPASDAADPYPHLTPAQEKALDRDGDDKPGGAPAGGNRRRGGL